VTTAPQLRLMLTSPPTSLPEVPTASAPDGVNGASRHTRQRHRRRTCRHTAHRIVHGLAANIRKTPQNLHLPSSSLHPWSQRPTLSKMAQFSLSRKLASFIAGVPSHVVQCRVIRRDSPSGVVLCLEYLLYSGSPTAFNSHV
jgi:hypothetical protein